MPRAPPSSASRRAMPSRTSRAKSLSLWPVSIALSAACAARLSGVSCLSLRLTLVVAHTPAAAPAVNQNVRRNIAASVLLPLSPPRGRDGAAHDHGTPGRFVGHILSTASD